jgi:hypothetical protein
MIAVTTCVLPDVASAPHPFCDVKTDRTICFGHVLPLLVSSEYVVNLFAVQRNLARYLSFSNNWCGDLVHQAHQGMDDTNTTGGAEDDDGLSGHSLGVDSTPGMHFLHFDIVSATH